MCSACDSQRLDVSRSNIFSESKVFVRRVLSAQSTDLERMHDGLTYFGGSV